MCLGKDASLTCIAQGKPPLNYQWYKDDQPVQKACFESFHIQSLSKTSEGIYHCKVTNDFDSVKSNKVDLIIGKMYDCVLIFEYILTTRVGSETRVKGACSIRVCVLLY